MGNLFTSKEWETYKRFKNKDIEILYFRPKYKNSEENFPFKQVWELEIAYRCYYYGVDCHPSKYITYEYGGKLLSEEYRKDIKKRDKNYKFVKSMVFTKEELLKFYKLFPNFNENTFNTHLSSLCKKGFIIRIKNGLYVLPKANIVVEPFPIKEISIYCFSKEIKYKFEQLKNEENELIDEFILWLGIYKDDKNNIKKFRELFKSCNKIEKFEIPIKDRVNINKKFIQKIKYVTLKGPSHSGNFKIPSEEHKTVFRGT